MATAYSSGGSMNETPTFEEQRRKAMISGGVARNECCNNILRDAQTGTVGVKRVG